MFYPEVTCLKKADIIIWHYYWLLNYWEPCHALIVGKHKLTTVTQLLQKPRINSQMPLHLRCSVPATLARQRLSLITSSPTRWSPSSVAFSPPPPPPHQLSFRRSFYGHISDRKMAPQLEPFFKQWVWYLNSTPLIIPRFEAHIFLLFVIQGGWLVCFIHWSYVTPKAPPRMMTAGD